MIAKNPDIHLVEFHQISDLPDIRTFDQVRSELRERQIQFDTSMEGVFNLLGGFDLTLPRPESKLVYEWGEWIYEKFPELRNASLLAIDQVMRNHMPIEPVLPRIALDVVRSSRCSWWDEKMRYEQGISEIFFMNFLKDGTVLCIGDTGFSTVSFYVVEAEVSPAYNSLLVYQRA